MSSRLIALVTGGASGIGEATARKLASRGISIVLADTNKVLGEEKARDIEKEFDVTVYFRTANVADERDVKSLIAYAASITGSLDYAANCAGVCESVWDEEESISTELFDRTLAVNTRGLWLCQKYQALQMRKQQPRNVNFTPISPVAIPKQKGAIANVASISGLHAKGLAAYTPSKYASIAITKNGAKFYGPDGIRCNAICPGWTMTAMIAHSMGKEGIPGTEENRESSVSREIALRRMAFPQEQANVLSFLLSDESSYMNGSIVVCDGGYHDIR